MPTKESEPQIRDGHSVRESDKQRNDRQMEIIWSGAYFPEGWEAPHLTAPPASSDAGAVGRAKTQVEALKAADFFSGPGQYRGWDDLPEAAKFYTLRHWVDWDGISQPDRAQIIGAQLDAYELAVLHIPEHQYDKAIDLPELVATAKALAAGHERDAMPTEEREPQIRIRPGTNNELGWQDDRSFDIHDAGGKIGFLTGYLGGPWSDTEFRVTYAEITAPGRKLSPSEWKDVLQGLRENLPEVAELVGGGKYGEGGGLSAAEEKLFRLPERDSRLTAEWTHDYGLRRMEDRGVKYEDEAGTIFNPTQGEIGEGRKPKKLPSPSEIADDNRPCRPGNGQDNGNDRGNGRER